ncbi:hypothetical protein KPL78_01440 [Roseomonas sp. HJA6]|uniref:Polysaccharide biosynthesis protein C-terminal domain-containing protein n=1 Tax=Roseomonas alba TaxID=2846776 RepID=A0ABS7A584_9PROT|nr:hypothetical protein [Neoroseomonas alba]MBW6396485.1 hypothetical protein [Neoroseomonas alba]
MIGGRIGFVCLWFIGIMLVYRGLGRDEAGLVQAGLFAVAIACVKIASGFIVDPGDLALMRRVPTLLHEDPAAAYALFRGAFALRMAMAAVVAVALLAFAALAGESTAASIAPLMGWIVVAILADALFRSVMVVLQASERFTALVLLEGMLQIARLVAVLMLWAGAWITVERVLAAYGAITLAAAVTGAALLLPAGLLRSLEFRRGDILELLVFLRWMVPAMMIGAVNERLDVMLVFASEGADAAGRYGAMAALAMTADIVAGSLSSVIQPRIARMRSDSSYTSNLRMFLVFSIPATTLALLAALLLAAPVVEIVLGAGYVPGVPAFLWLLAGTLFWLAIAPLPLAMVAVHAPSLTVVIALCQTVLVTLVGFALLNVFGIVGMAQGVCVARVGVALLLLAHAQRLARGKVEIRLGPREVSCGELGH